MCTPSSSGIRLPEAWIDDPSRGCRILNRAMLFLMQPARAIHGREHGPEGLKEFVNIKSIKIPASP
jgi:hypothetical protein